MTSWLFRFIRFTSSVSSTYFYNEDELKKNSVEDLPSYSTLLSQKNIYFINSDATLFIEN